MPEPNDGNDGPARTGQTLSGARPLVAIFVAVFVTIFLFMAAFFLSLILWDIFPDFRPPVGEVWGSNSNARGNYPFFATLALALSAGIWAGVYVWDPAMNSKSEAAVTIVFFLVILSISSINFAVHDQLMTRTKQALVDVVLVVLGLATCYTVYEWRSARPIAKALRSFVLFAVATIGVFVPLFYFTIYILSRLGIEVPEGDGADSWIKAISGILAAIMSLIAFGKPERRSRFVLKRSHDKDL